MVRGEDDQSVVPLASRLDRRKGAAELCIDLGDHTEIGRLDLAEVFLAEVRDTPARAGDEICEGHEPEQVPKQRMHRRFRLNRRRAAKLANLVRREHRVVGLRHDERRMRAQEAQMREPRRLLLAEPADELAGEERRLRLVLAVAGRRAGDLAGIAHRQMRQRAIGEIDSLAAQPAQPGLFVLGQAHAHVEPGQHALIGPKPRISRLQHRGIGRLVGVAEQRRRIAGPARRQRHVVEAVRQWAAVADHAVGHLVEAGIEARPRRRAGGGIRVVLQERRAFGRQRIDVRRADHRMTGDAKALTAPLVGGDEQDVEHQSLRTRISLLARVTFTRTSCAGGGVRWSLKVSTWTALPWPRSTLRRMTEPRKLTSDTVPSSTMTQARPKTSDTTTDRNEKANTTPNQTMAGSDASGTIWPSIDTALRAGSATLALNVLSWPTKVATNRVAGLL